MPAIQYRLPLHCPVCGAFMEKAKPEQLINPSDEMYVCISCAKWTGEDVIMLKEAGDQYYYRIE